MHWSGRGVQPLYSMVPHFIDVNGPVGADGNSRRALKLTRFHPARSGLSQQLAGRRKLIDTIVAGIRREDIALRVQGQARQLEKLPVIGAVDTPLFQWLARGR